MADERQYCTFYLRDLHFGLDVLKVQEIISYQEMTRVPLAPPVVRGLINLRGQIVTALDLRRRLGFPDRPADQLPVNVVVQTDDGKVMTLDASGKDELIATDAKRRWIDNVALHPDGAFAWSAGKIAYVRAPKGEDKFFEVPSTVGGLAFAPKGLRLAIAHYNGVTLWFPNMAGNAEFLEWAGSHLGVMFSPDNRFLVTTMHEPALHGWRLADSKHMRMTGYPSRVRSMAWTIGGKGLATSGADSVIIWPFASKDGPMGKQPAMLAPLLVSGVIFAERVAGLAERMSLLRAYDFGCGLSQGVGPWRPQVRYTRFNPRKLHLLEDLRKIMAAQLAQIAQLKANREDLERSSARVAQLVIVPIPAAEPVEVADLPDSARGSGGFGSTGLG